ncbi:MAG TPA: hypothetical protein VFG32_11435 [Bacteroidota bacterium]|nr:hypothetical protein [Bacteroidota bacterium]
MHKSINGGSNWVESGGFPHQDNVRITKIAFHPQNDNIVYVSATEPNGGVYRTPDDGETWDQRVAGMDITEIRAVAVSQQNPSILFAGSTTYVGEGFIPARIYKSTNEGITWTTPYTFSTPVFISDVVFDPTSSLIAYVTTQANKLFGIPEPYPGGVLKTTDGGQTWAEKNNGIINRDVKSIAIDPITPTTLYIATGLSFYFSTDGGESWQERTAGAEIAPTGGLVAYNDTLTSLVGTDLSLLSSRFLPNAGSFASVCCKQSVF